jgi:subfamily B ATP-binding cassette protein MsbA
MKSLLRILRLAIPYKRQAVLGVLFNILSVIFSLVSFTFFIPVLDILFNQTKKVLRPPLPLDWSNPWNISKENISDHFYYTVGDLIEKNGSLSALFYISVSIIMLFFVKNLFRYLGMFFIDALRVGVIKDLRNTIFNKILVLPLSFFTEQRKGDIIARSTNDVQEIEWSVASSLEMLFRDPLSIVLSFTFLYLMSPELTFFVIVLFPPSGFLIAKIGNSLRKTSVKQQSKMGDILSMLEETLGGLKIIKAFNAINLTDHNFKKENEEYSRLTLSMYRKRDLASPTSEFLGAVIMVAVLLYAGKLVLDPQGSLSGSVFIMYLVVFSQMIPPVKSLTSAIYNIQKGAASVERIEKILNAPEIIEEKENAIPITTLKNAIDLKNISFQYENKPVLKNINFTIRKGQSIALVGPSGGGKSTIANLLPRFYDCKEGDILIDDISIRDYSISGVRSLFGIVTQEPILFNDTIYNNILFGFENASKEDVIEAAKIAHAHDFILQTEKGYDTIIGDSGTKLSGGQRQRISIARAVLRKPSVFIFDEATSSLDTESERLVQKALEDLLASHTSIVIAHRLSTIKNVDTILVLEKGRIVEQGSHNELLKQKGLYHKLYNMQYFEE